MSLFTKADLENSSLAKRASVFTNALDGDLPFVFVMYCLELLKEIKRHMVIPSHAYMYARIKHGAPKTTCPGEWNKYLSQYEREVELDTAKNMNELIYDLATGILRANPLLKSAGLPKEIHTQICGIDKSSYGYERNISHDSIELALRHMDLTEPDKRSRGHVFTLEEITDIFSGFLQLCVRPVKDEKDLLARTTPSATWQFATGLAIIYRLMSKNTDPYWYVYECLRPVACESMLHLIPVRTPEAALFYKPEYQFNSRSIEVPVVIDGLVDRYLALWNYYFGPR